eukprot:6279134-Amphidinium_carterae.1
MVSPDSPLNKVLDALGNLSQASRRQVICTLRQCRNDVLDPTQEVPIPLSALPITHCHSHCGLAQWCALHLCSSQWSSKSGNLMTETESTSISDPAYATDTPLCTIRALQLPVGPSETTAAGLSSENRTTRPEGSLQCAPALHQRPEDPSPALPGKNF